MDRQWALVLAALGTEYRIKLTGMTQTVTLAKRERPASFGLSVMLCHGRCPGIAHMTTGHNACASYGHKGLPASCLKSRPPESEQTTVTQGDLTAAVRAADPGEYH